MVACNADFQVPHLQGRMTRSQFTNWLCQEATRACRAKAPKLPKDRAPGPVFVEQDPQEAQMAKMMASMKVSWSFTRAFPLLYVRLKLELSFWCRRWAWGGRSLIGRQR